MDINSAKKIIKAANLADDTVIMEGLHGIGKSNIVKQFANEEQMFCVELFLSHMEVGDVIGIPRTITHGIEVVTTWTKPIWLQRMVDKAWPVEFDYSTISYASEDIQTAVEANLSSTSGTITREALNTAYAAYLNVPAYELHLVTPQKDIKCSASQQSVLFLDELNRAPIDVRQSSLQLVLEKQIHEHSLPYVDGKAALIVAAINPSKDYQVDELDAALLDRFLHIEVEADIKSFLEWARSTNLNPIVRDFLAENPKKLHFQPTDGSIGATPRSWSKLASFIDNIAAIPPEVHHPIMKGKLGSALASEFLTYFNTYSKAIKLEDVEKAIAKAKKSKSTIEEVAAVVTKLMKDQEVIQKTEMANNFFDKYIKKSKAEDAYPLFAYLYSLELELRASFIKQLKEGDPKNYATLAKYDGTINNKDLFRSIVKVAYKEQ